MMCSLPLREPLHLPRDAPRGPRSPRVSVAGDGFVYWLFHRSFTTAACSRRSGVGATGPAPRARSQFQDSCGSKHVRQATHASLSATQEPLPTQPPKTATTPRRSAPGPRSEEDQFAE